MRGRSPSSGLLTLMLAIAGCASRGASAERSPSPRSAPETSEPSARGDAIEDDIDAQLEREIRLHVLRLEHRDPAERVRARLDLADAYAHRAGRVELTRSELDVLRFEATGSQRADLERLDEELATQRSQWLERAATAYGIVLESTHPVARALRAEARFGLADVRIQQGDVAAARPLLTTLVREDSEHGLVGPALLQLGDDAFDQGRLAEASELYERVLASDAARDHSYARYKLGWVALNLADGQAALDHWTRVVTESRHQPNGQALAKAAARDCVIAYAMVGRPEQAGTFFARLHPKLARELLERLARQYVDQRRPEAAAIVQGHGPSATAPGR